jgi:hypothetical protein
MMNEFSAQPPRVKLDSPAVARRRAHTSPTDQPLGMKPDGVEPGAGSRREMEGEVSLDNRSRQAPTFKAGPFVGRHPM